MESEYEKGLEKDFEKFLIILGKQLKQGRLDLGFETISTFANIVDIAISTIGKYERGEENLTVKRLYTLLRAQNKSHEQIVEMFSTIPSPIEKESSFSLPEQAEQQVKQQVKIKLGRKEADSLDTSHIKRIYLLLAFCAPQKRRKKQLQEIFGLKSYTRHFDKCLNICLSAEWIKMTKPNQPNSNDQKYYTTEAGKKVLRLGKTGEND